MVVPSRALTSSTPMMFSLSSELSWRCRWIRRIGESEGTPSAASSASQSRFLNGLLCIARWRCTGTLGEVGGDGASTRVLMSSRRVSAQ